MKNKTDTVRVNFKVDKELKEQADKLFKDLGLNTNIALKMFLIQCVREQRIPFKINLNNGEY